MLLSTIDVHYICLQNAVAIQALPDRCQVSDAFRIQALPDRYQVSFAEQDLGDSPDTPAPVSDSVCECAICCTS